MISNFKRIAYFFEEADKHLKNTVHLYLIGGGMMLFNQLKVATKDIDLIVETKKEFKEFERALISAGFLGKTPTRGYEKMDLSQIFIRDEFRIDIFERTVCSGFSLTNSMKQRAVKSLKLKNINLYICSAEDVFIFKTFTEREGDIDDCIALVERGIDWNIILEEIKSQIKKSGNKVWITWVGERLDILEERGLIIPIMKEVNKLREKYFDEYEKKSQKD